MKKIALFLVVIMMLSSLISCDIILGLGDSGSSNTPSGGDNQQGGNQGNQNDSDNLPDEKPDEKPGDSNDSENNNTPPPEDDLKLIEVNACEGLNEQIYISLKNVEDTSYTVFYKSMDEEYYTRLDDQLIIKSGDKVECYILGIKAGKYKIKIKAGQGIAVATEEIDNIEVAAQDRSGYAHFNNNEGVGAYNNDGTLKAGTKIVYVTNENKNTVTLEIDGTEYVGFVNILQAQYRSDTPMLVRVIGKITTNQWNYKNVEPRLADDSNADSTFFENTFSTEYGENLANLIVKMKFNGGINGAGQTYNYRTTPEGLTDVRITNGGTSSTMYKGSDFPALKGKTVYEDDSYYNMLEVKGSKNITIEGIGTDVEFFQFGISFEECNNIEIKNITFTDYPEDALNFLGGNRSDLANYGGYWVHNCTFNRGYNAWDISGERDKYAGDGSIDFNNVSSTTLAYNKFNECKKTMLFGSGDSSACMNFTMQHNYFYKVESRLPLSRNSNIHSYNNYFDQCKNCASTRENSYLFSESNYYFNCSKPFDNESKAVKSYGDIFDNSNKGSAVIATSRNQVVSNSCKPNSKTNYSKFDTDSTLFYYDAENGISDVDYLLSAEDVPEFVQIYAGAGVMVRLP